MKAEIGPVDAIEIEAVSAAFVENFALKVFQSADNEDRRGVATRYVRHFPPDHSWYLHSSVE